ncbi:GNAT family N-acetyltransferase [Neobacillus sp. PS3-40]|uniref:GNAT family N-acetyltransferase n=1 Tax=Neobacillus sp. PS3-40 TaxID=3070679 RepID=UPI0027E18276|nr:GNAT family N-acetyltransferase [Neobacillus sp. PS3-40]WML42988.1 GNAT family N-acetyltransferase [Neobacillus sp. PS3-40]
MKFKMLSECTIEEAVIAWNRGFEGYFVKIEMTPQSFMNRIISEGISLDLSRVLFDENEPIAIILNGFRITKAGKKIAWNGGTGVAPAYRGKGSSKLLMEETMRIYHDEGVDIATLEAIKENEKAIRLYEKYGYQITDRLVYLNGVLKQSENTPIPIISKSIRPEQLQMIPFYNENVPWQCQWQSAKEGEAQIYHDENQSPLGYSLFRKVWNLEGKLEKVLLYQIELLNDVDEKTIYPAILENIAKDKSTSTTFIAINFNLENPISQFLLENGLHKTIEQVQMMK